MYQGYHKTFFRMTSLEMVSGVRSHDPLIPGTKTVPLKWGNLASGIIKAKNRMTVDMCVGAHGGAPGAWRLTRSLVGLAVWSRTCARGRRRVTVAVCLVPAGTRCSGRTAGSLGPALTRTRPFAFASLQEGKPGWALRTELRKLVHARWTHAMEERKMGYA